nr:PIN domain-containing protein [Escherichia coli]
MEENNTSTDKNTLTALIDYENCGSLKNISLEQYGELIIFVGPQQNVVVLPADSFPEGARITIRQVSGVSRNNVDFHLVLELGRISCCAAGKDKTYHIISSDKGYDGVIRTLKEAGITCIRRDVPESIAAAGESGADKSNCLKQPSVPESDMRLSVSASGIITETSAVYVVCMNIPAALILL